jgi:hypothetical protein
MANNRINRYIGALTLGMVLTTVPSCTDTWDDHYNVDESTLGATATLWETIKDNPEYSRFADIVRHSKYFKDDTHPVAGYTYEDVLNGGQVNTVWVPDNSALTEAEYQKWMQFLESDNPLDAYNVQQQFLGNHIALWRHRISEPGIDTVRMINGKNLIFDKGNRTLGGISLGDYNIPTTNGIMHVIKGVAPFYYNFYEYLKFYKKETIFGSYVVSRDTTRFYESASVEGLPDENGNPTYVDSVYRTSNRMFDSRNYLPNEGSEKWQMAEKSFGARINVEDSAFVMLIPTDVAWSAVKSKYESAYVYGTKYVDRAKGDLNENNVYADNLDADSLKKMSLEMDMVAPLVFNVNKQPKREGETKLWTLEDFKKYKGETGTDDSRKNYLLNTYGDTLRNIVDPVGTIEWDRTSLFQGEPIEMSNGLAYEVDELNFPSQYFTPDVEVEIEYYGNFYRSNSDYNYSKYDIGKSSGYFSLSNSTYKDFTDIYGQVSRNNIYYLQQRSDVSGPRVEIKLQGNNPNAYVPSAQVMSGRYDIQLVTVPYWYLDLSVGFADDYYIIDTLVTYNDQTQMNDTTIERTLDKEFIQMVANNTKYKFKTQITYNNGTKETTSKAVEKTTDGLKVDTITIAENFEFPNSYKNLRYCYPTLYIEASAKSTDIKKGFVYDLIIDKVILKRRND